MPKPFESASMPKPANSPKRSLNANDWIQAALDVIAGSGVESVVVEPLARGLKVTKGSFYWHFANREALVNAALKVWEHQEAVEMIERAEAESEPRERLHTLFRTAANTDKRAEQILLSLSGSKHPAARACVSRVTEAWRTYIESCYLALGLDPEAARNWATLAYSTFVGTVRMRQDNPEVLPDGPAFSDYLRFLIRSLIPSTEMSSVSVVPMRMAG